MLLSEPDPMRAADGDEALERAAHAKAHKQEGGSQQGQQGQGQRPGGA
jgi:hypothetical protein